MIHLTISLWNKLENKALNLVSLAVYIIQGPGFAGF